MQYPERLSLLPVLLILLISCQEPERKHAVDYHIEWDESSLVCIADEGAYPRLRRLDDGSLLAAYENRRGDVMVRKSMDNGTTWGESVKAFEAFDHEDIDAGASTRVNIANPELIQLPGGDILLAVNLRPRLGGIYPFSIALKRSHDEGKSWADSKILYQAGTIFRDGCWEPSFLLLPDGRVQIYFANESPYRESDEQEISMLTSSDNGNSWSSEPVTVSFRRQRRDGMPVAVHNGKEIYVAIEDNRSGQFKPYIVKSSIHDDWREPVLEDSPNRYAALRHALPDTVYAGAPYLIRTESDLYLLSYQTTQHRTSEWEHSTMEVVVSDQPADFRNPTHPFEVPLSKEAKWGSLTDLGGNTIAALSSTNFNSDKIGVWMIKGEIVQKINR
jgi:hypothetical protein